MEPSYEITPDPTEEEREAIVKALAAEEAERGHASAWSDALLPGRSGAGDEP